MASKYSSDVDVQAAFKKFDVNNDGVLDRNEMEAVQREIESEAMRKSQGGRADQRHGVSSEVLEAQVERIETFVVAVHGSCSALHEALAQASSECSPDAPIHFWMRDFFAAVSQNTACIKEAMKQVQALHVSMQLLQARMVKLGSGVSDESGVKSKVKIVCV
jgi:hypothetical protein